MELNGSQHIRRNQAQVWAALNDPAVLQRCVPGCESFEAAGENQYQVLMAIVVGPVKARFKGKLLLSDVQAPHSYAMTFEGSGGAAGFGKGTARVSLAPSGDGTDLDYTAQAQVGGKLAQVGARLIDGVAGKMAGEFFARFKEAIEPAGEAPDAPSAVPPAAEPAETGSPRPPSGPAAGSAGDRKPRPLSGYLLPVIGLAVVAAGAGWLLYG